MGITWTFLQHYGHRCLMGVLPLLCCVSSFNIAIVFVQNSIASSIIQYIHYILLESRQRSSKLAMVKNRQQSNQALQGSLRLSVNTVCYCGGCLGSVSPRWDINRT